MNKIALFIYVLSLVYIIKHIAQLILIMKQDNPIPLKLSNIQQGLLYGSITYAITYMLTWFL